MKPSVWTPERVETLKRLWAEHHSAAEIARAIGCGLTRCAVLGKAHRLDLPTHAAPRKLYRTFARTWMPPAEKRAAKPKPEMPAPLNIPFLALEASHCRYVVNDAHPYVFCGQQKRSGSSYCAHHHALTHTTPLGLSAGERERRAARARHASPLLTQQKLEDEAIRVLPQIPGEAA